MRFAKGELIASLFFAVFISGLIALLYNLNLESNSLILVPTALLTFLIASYLFQNQRKNQKKWEKRPTTFPNPQGGGILGLYMERTWREELAELGRRYKGKGKKSPEKK